MALCIAGGARAVSMTNNPDELSRWSVAEVESGGGVVQGIKSVRSSP